MLAGVVAVLVVVVWYLKANVDTLHADKREMQQHLKEEHDQTRAVQSAWCESIQNIEDRTNWAVMPDQYAYLCGMP